MARTSELVTATARIAAEVAAKHAADVDADARFPREAFAALKAAKLLSAAVPRSHGGHGAGMLELGRQCAALAQGCGSAAMVLAMHHIQVACLARRHARFLERERHPRQPPPERFAAIEGPIVELGTIAQREAREEVTPVAYAGILESASVAGVLEQKRIDLQFDRWRPPHAGAVGLENMLAERKLDRMKHAPQSRPGG